MSHVRPGQHLRNERHLDGRNDAKQRSGSGKRPSGDQGDRGARLWAVGKWAVLAFWIAVVVVAGPLAGKLNGAQQNDASAWLPHNAESTRVIELAKRFTPTDTFPAVVVYELPGPATHADQARAAADAERFAGLDHVGKVVGPIPASDGRALEVVVPVEMGSGGWNDIAPVVEEMRSIAGSGGGSVHVTGPAGYATDFANVFNGFDATLLYITAAIVIVILLLTYRSPTLWLLPLTCVFVALRPPRRSSTCWPGTPG